MTVGESASMDCDAFLDSPLCAGVGISLNSVGRRESRRIGSGRANAERDRSEKEGGDCQVGSTMAMGEASIGEDEHTKGEIEEVERLLASEASPIVEFGVGKRLLGLVEEPDDRCIPGERRRVD